MRPRDDAETGPDWSAHIVDIAQRRDREKFAALFRYFAPRLKAFFAKQGVLSGVAEDLAQDTMLMVWRKAAYFDPGRASAATWIFTVARNLRIDLRRRERDPRLLENYADIEPEPGPAEQASSAQREERIRAALTQLPEEQAEVVRLSFFEDKPHSEIARALDIPLGTVKSRLRLAMNRLRLLVEEL
jgi:RNA polymerase sigma-70 factor (ECF subfamily)